MLGSFAFSFSDRIRVNFFFTFFTDLFWSIYGVKNVMIHRAFLKFMYMKGLPSDVYTKPLNLKAFHTKLHQLLVVHSFTQFISPNHQGLQAFQSFFFLSHAYGHGISSSLHWQWCMILLHFNWNLNQIWVYPSTVSGKCKLMRDASQKINKRLGGWFEPTWTNVGQIGNLPQARVDIKHIPNKTTTHIV